MNGEKLHLEAESPLSELETERLEAQHLAGRVVQLLRAGRPIDNGEVQELIEASRAHYRRVGDLREAEAEAQQVQVNVN